MTSVYCREARLLREELKYIGVKKSLSEINKIHFLAEKKYNRYDQYLPGETFQHRLIKWLLNFENETERQIAMEIIENLIYFNMNELRALIVATFWNSVIEIQKEIINRNKTDLQVYLNYKKRKISEALQRSVFISVSDDVMIDYFRRRAQRRYPELLSDNFISYYKLHEDCQEKDLKFLKEYDRIFLIDQLCGSGNTFLRNIDGWTGKIVRFHEIWKKAKIEKIYYMPYIISTVAENNLNRKLQQWEKEKSIKTDIRIVPTIRIPVSNCLISKQNDLIDKDKPVAKLCEKYYKSLGIINPHIKVGGDATWGFGQAGLTLVLNNNCPNNSIPIIWYNRNKDWFSLFPRIEHHQ